MTHAFDTVGIAVEIHQLTPLPLIIHIVGTLQGLDPSLETVQLPNGGSFTPLMCVYAQDNLASNAQFNLSGNVCSCCLDVPDQGIALCGA